MKSNLGALKLGDQVYTMAQLKEMELLQLEGVITDLSIEHEDIASQMRRARADFAAKGISANYDWYRQADIAKRIMSGWLKRLSQLRKEVRHARGPDVHRLREIMKRRLTSDVYASVWDEYQEAEYASSSSSGAVT